MLQFLPGSHAVHAVTHLSGLCAKVINLLVMQGAQHITVCKTTFQTYTKHELLVLLSGSSVSYCLLIVLVTAVQSSSSGLVLPW